jgi:hypothetical protein
MLSFKKVISWNRQRLRLAEPLVITFKILTFDF